MNAPYVVPSTKAVVYLSGRLIYLETNTDFCLCFHALVKSGLAVALGDSWSVSESLCLLFLHHQHGSVSIVASNRVVECVIVAFCFVLFGDLLCSTEAALVLVYNSDSCLQWRAFSCADLQSHSLVLMVLEQRTPKWNIPLSHFALMLFLNNYRIKWKPRPSTVCLLTSSFVLTGFQSPAKAVYNARHWNYPEPEEVPVPTLSRSQTAPVSETFQIFPISLFRGCF